MKIKRLLKSCISLLKTKNIQPIIQTVGNCDLLDGKTAFVVGATGGIGKSISKTLIENGCKVVVGGSRSSTVDGVVSELGSSAAGVVIDLNQPDTFEAVVDEASSLFGPIDILVNAAGIHTEDPSMRGFLDFSPEEFDRILNVNLRGSYFICQAAARRMISEGVEHGHILLVSSSAGNEPAWSPYRISKWGLKGITEGMASALVGHGIIVNAIAPGCTATSLLDFEKGDSIYAEDNRLGRFAMPEEIAQIALMLVSPLGDMIVGDTLYASGGRGVCDIR